MQTMIKARWARRMAFFMAVVVGLFSLVPRVDAGLVPSAESWADLGVEKDLAMVQKVLEDKAVKGQLKALGFSEEEIQARLDQLSDEEIHGLAAQLETITAGGFIIELLVLILLVIVVYNLTTGKKVVISR